MTKTFRKDTERCRKRGYDMELLKKAIRLLEVDGQLPQTYRPHKLSSDYAGCWDVRLKVGISEDYHIKTLPNVYHFMFLHTISIKRRQSVHKLVIIFIVGPLTP